MANRKPISNKLRFEVFKRDSFKCQYCGKSAPDVILNVDHIHPVAKNGDADILNLVTSCFECNSGKSDRLLSDNSVVSMQKAQLDELNQRREQLNMMIIWKKAISNKDFEIDSIVEYFNDKNKSNISLTEIGIKNLKSLLKKYSVENILDAINEAYDKYLDIEVVAMWNKIPVVLGYINSSESDKNKMKLFGGIKARFSDTTGYSSWNTIHINKKLREIYSFIDSGEYVFGYSDLFKILNSNYTYKEFMVDIENLHESFIKNN